VTGSGPLTIKNFSTGQFGIRLMDEWSYGAATRSEFQKIDHYTQVGNDPAGNPLYEPVYAPFFDDGANDSRSSILLTPIGDENNLIYAGGGNDVVTSGARDDQLMRNGASILALTQ